MPSYKYDNLKIEFTQYVASHREQGIKAVLCFIAEYRAKMPEFPREATVYNWYSELIGTKKMRVKHGRYK